MNILSPTVPSDGRQAGQGADPPGIRKDTDKRAGDALQRFAAVNVDFADAWLAARAAHLGFGVASFDRDLDRFKDIRRTEPKV